MNTKNTQNGNQADRRKNTRKTLTAPVRARFNLEVEGIVTEISSDGMTIVLNPPDCIATQTNRNIPVHLDMNGRLVSIEACIRQASHESDKVRIGISYDRSQIAVFDFSGNHK